LTEKKRITADDFFTGIFAVLTAKNCRSLQYSKNFEKDMEKLFKEFLPLAEKKDFMVCFRIKLHEFHQDSITVANGLLAARQRGVFHFDGKKHDIITIDFTKEWAESILKDNPWGELFQEFSPKIIETFLQR
jgi:hypothetical protein